MKNQQQFQHSQQIQLPNITADPESWEHEFARKAAYASVGSVEDRERLGVGASGRSFKGGITGQQSATNDYFDTHEYEGPSQPTVKRRMRMPSSGAEEAAESSLGMLSSRVLLFDRNTNFTFHDSRLVSSSKISQKMGAQEHEKFANQVFNRHLQNHNIHNSNILQMKKQRVQDSIQTMIAKGQAQPSYDALGSSSIPHSMASRAENFVSKLTDKRMVTQNTTHAASNLDTARASQQSQGEKVFNTNPLSSLHGNDSSINYLEPNHTSTQKRSRISLLMNTGNEVGVIKTNAGMKFPPGLQSKGSPMAARLNQSQIIREGYHEPNNQRSMNPFAKFQTPMSKAQRQLSEQQFQERGFRNSQLDPSKFDFDFSSQNTALADVNHRSQILRNGREFKREYGRTQDYSGTLAPKIESVKQYVQFKDQIQAEELGEADSWLTSTMKDRALINKIIASKAMKSGQLNHFQMQAQFKKAKIRQSTERPQGVQVDPNQSTISQRFEKERGRNYLANAVGTLAPLSLRHGPGGTVGSQLEQQMNEIQKSQIKHALQKHHRYVSRDEAASQAGRHSVIIERSQYLTDKANSSAQGALTTQPTLPNGIHSQMKTPKAGKLQRHAEPGGGQTPQQNSKLAGLAHAGAAQGRHRTQMDKYQSPISHLQPARINRAAAQEAHFDNAVASSDALSARTSEYTDYDDDDEVEQAAQQDDTKRPVPRESGASEQSPADESDRQMSLPKQKLGPIQSTNSQPWSSEQQDNADGPRQSTKKVNFPKHATATPSGPQSEQDFVSASLSTPVAGLASKAMEDLPSRARAALDSSNEQTDGRPKDVLRKMTTKLGDTDIQIQNTLANALASSRNDDGIDPAIFAELKQLNKRFMDQAQLDQLWVIEQKNSWVQGAKQLEQKIQQECQERRCLMGPVPTLDKLPATTRAIGDERVRNYQANLAALELSVFEEFNKDEETPPTPQNEEIPSQGHYYHCYQNPSKKIKTRRKAAGGSRLSKGRAKAVKEQAPESQASGNQPTWRSIKEQIAEKMALRHVEDLKGLQRKGVKMIGDKGNIDFEALRAGQVEQLYKVIKYVHKRQHDLLIHHQPGDKRSYEENFMMELEAEKKEEAPASTGTKSENDSDDESEGSEAEEEYKQEESESPAKTMRLPMIKKKYPNLSIGTSEYFNNKIEVDFNNKYAEILKENETKYLLKQKQEIAIFLERFKEGQINKNDEQYKRYMRLLAGKIEQIRRTKNATLNRMQEYLMQQVLTEQFEQQANIHARGDSQLTNLAMLKSKKPKPEVKKMLAAQENAELHDYIGDLRGTRVAKAAPPSVLTRQALYVQDEASKERSRLNSQASVLADHNLHELLGESSGPLASSPLLRSGRESALQSAHMSLNGMSRQTTSKEALRAPSEATLASKNQRLQRGRMIEASIKQYTSPRASNIGKSVLLRNAVSLGPSRSGTEEQLPEQGDLQQYEKLESRATKEVATNRVFQNADAAQRQKRLVDQVSRDLIHKVRSIDAKRSLVTSEKARMEAQSNPALIYFNQILNSLEIDLPIFQMVQDDELVIENYLLRPGHCEAILKGLQSCQAQAKQFFNQVIFNGNQLKDRDFSQIVAGLNCLTYLKKLQYQNNDFGGLSLQSLAPILQRSQPYHLKALVLSNCNLNSTVLTGLLELLCQKSSLQVLALQKAIFDKGAVTSLVEFLEKNQKLKKLDLSWCELRATGFKPILECLSRNRRLEDINLSWNDISDLRDEPGAEELDRAKPPKVQSTEEKEQEQIERQLESAQYIVAMLKYNKKLRHLDLSSTGLTPRMFELICSNLKKAMSLLGLHLSGNPFLLEVKDDFKEAIKTIRAKKLKPDDYPVFPEQKEILKPQERQEMFMLNRIAEKQKSANLSIQVIDPFIQRKCIIQRKIGHKLDIPLSGQWQILRDVQGSEPERNGNVDFISSQSKKTEPKGNSMLKKKHGRSSNEQSQAAALEKEECWCCHHYQYTLIFWSQSIQFQQQRAARKLQNDYVDIFAQHLQEAKLLPAPDPRGLTFVSEKSDEEADQQETHSVNYKFQNLDGAGPNEETQPDHRDSKLLAGPLQMAERSHSTRSCRLEPQGNALAGDASVQGAGADPAAELEEGKEDVASAAFNSTRSSIQPPLIYMATNNWQPVKMLDAIEFAASLDPEKPAEEDVLQVLKDKGKIPHDIHHVDDLSKIQKGWVANEKIRLENNYRKKWADILISNLPYKRPCLINSEYALQAAARKEPVYVYPVFLKPGKHSFLVAQQDEFDEATIEKTIQTCVIGVREEPLPANVKTSAKKANVRRFEKHSSVFAKWQEDDDNLYYSILNNHDYVKWKLTRFVKDDGERAFVTKFIREHIAQLKEVYAQLQSESTNYPGISQLAFSDFCQDSGLLGKHFNISTADRLFISANYNDAADAGANSAKELLRYEFLEVLVRIAKVKYLDAGIYDSYRPALEHLITEELSTYSSKQTWQKWRTEELWTIGCNDVLKANLDGLNKLYKSLVAPRSKSKKVKIADACDLFARDSALKISDKQCKYCFGMSKMTVVNEEWEAEKYNVLAFVEFLEMIGRVADITFHHTDIAHEPLARRIEYVLDAILPLVDVERHDPVIEEVDETESDQEY